MRIDTHAIRTPDKPAVVFAPSGDVVTCAELDERSRRLARGLRDRGIEAGDSVAILMDNRPAYFEVAWAAQRSGLSWSPVNWHLTEDEVRFVIHDCDADAIVAAAPLAALAQQALNPAVRVRLVAGGAAAGFEGYERFVAAAPNDPPVPELEGSVMYYSSGTTGRPKGVRRPWPREAYGTGVPLDTMQRSRFGFDENTVYLCPAPLYHAAPTSWSMGALRLGGTVVLMDRFDAEEALALIERYRVTHVQLVPTMFIRMLRLPPGVRNRYDVGSLRMAIHASAPCPEQVKDAMLAWWGDVVHEYYAGTEANGFCTISPEEWRAHRGSVGLPFKGALHILDDDGRELGPGETGTVYFEGTAGFAYHRQPGATAAAFTEEGWSTLGDVGYLDADGYLFLTGRKASMIVSGGVNVYPQEIENLLALHPAVADVAVVGMPDPDLGEVVTAYVQPMGGAVAGPELGSELVAYCRDRLAHFKCPRSVVFVDALPRLPTGKLAKRLLRGMR